MTTVRLTIIGRSSAGQPRTLRLARSTAAHARRDAAYRRLVAVALRLDVATLATALRARRLSTSLDEAA